MAQALAFNESTRSMTQPSAATDDISLATHVSQLLPLSDTQRETYLDALGKPLAQELRGLLAFESTSLDLSKATGVSIAQTLLHRTQPETLGRWQVLKPLGQGGMGTVYLVCREELGVRQRAAAKLGMAHGLGDATLAAIQREASALSRLQHGNIATLLDFGVTHTNEPFVISEFIEGELILDYIAAKGLDLRGALKLYQQLLHGVTAAHAQLVLHLDIKPSNVLVTSKGVVKLIDFGLAGFMGGGGPDQERSIPFGYTDAYASPEQRSGLPVTVKSDVFSLGKLLGDILHSIKIAESPSLQLKEARSIVDRATERDPLQRYASVTDLNADVEALLSLRPIAPLSNSRLYRWRKFARRHWLPVSLGLAALLALTFGLIGVALQYRQTVAEKDRALRLLESEKATSDFFSDSIRTASVFGGGNADTTVGEMIEHMVKTLPEAEKMSPRAMAWLAGDLAAVLTGRGDMDLALEACELAIANAKLSDEVEDDIAHWTQLALTAGQAHQYERALLAAERARSIAEPIAHWRLPWAYLARMQTLVKMKRWQDVEDLWPTIAAIPTDRPSVRGNIDYMRGTARIRLGDFDGAKQDLTSANRIYRSRYGARSVPAADTEYRLFQLAVQSGQFEEAFAATANLRSLFVDAYGEAHYRHGVLAAEIALLHLFADQVDRASSLMASAIEQIQSSIKPVAPTLGHYQTQYARILLSAAQPDRAAAVLGQGLTNLQSLSSTHPDVVDAQVTLGEMALIEGNFEAAASQFAMAEKAIKIASAGTRYRYYRGLSLVAIQQGHPAACERHLAALREIKLVVLPPLLPGVPDLANGCLADKHMR